MNPRKPIVLAITAVMFMLNAQAQNESPCASDAIYNNLIATDSLFSRSMMYLNYRLSHMPVDDPMRSSDEIYVIPTVVHIIHEGEGLGQLSNISDEQVFSAIEALNNDFRKVAGTQGDGDGVDVGVEFCLASRDPEGNATTGIVRVNGTVIPNYADMGIEASSGVGANEADVKALSTWPREEYMNIWVVNEIENNDAGGGVQGFAYFPFNSPLDGITILYNAFGTVGNLKPNTDENRTLTHEVGHYLGLYHTFHDTDACDDETNCVTQGDRVCDTPATPLSTMCSSPACGTQQVENYMDYTSETCRNMFTDGQKLRMRATLLEDRGSVLESFGCVPVTDYDAGIASIEFPGLSICSSTFDPEIILTNYGSTTLTSVQITYSIDNGPDQSYSWSGSLSQGQSTNVSLPSISGTVGMRTIHMSCHSPNGVADENTSNDELDKTFEISNGEALQLEISIDYFGTETSWIVHDDGGNVVATGGPYINNAQGTIYNESICVTGGCYTFTMFDTYGDGMSFLNGFYTLVDGNGDTIAEGSGNFGEEAIHTFCVETVVNNDPPTANFTNSGSTACEGGQIDYYDASANGPTSWSWTFEGGVPQTSSNASPQNITYNTPGTYDVTLTVSNDGGSDTYTSTVTIVDGPTASLSSSAISCHDGNDGVITATAGGTGPFSYNWSNGGTSASISGLSSGNYSLMLTDGIGCTATASTFLSNPSAMNLSLVADDPLCNNASNGSLTATASNGGGGYTYSWSNGMTGSAISNIPAGNYTVVATDANGCTASASATLYNPSAISLNLSSTPVSCPGNGDGSVSVSASGGAGNYTYAWSNGLTLSTISNLPAGTYTVTATDANGCAKNGNVTIQSPQPVAVNLFDFDIACGGSSGSANVSPSGGTGAYTVSWSNGATGTSVSNLSEGSYSVTVSDNNGCSATEDFEITSSDALGVQIETSPISCFGMADGSLDAIVNGGSGSYTYNWTGGSTGTGINNLSAGTYTVEVEDSEGCPGTASVTLTEPAELELAVFKTDISCNGMADGTATATAGGGTGVLAISWSNGSTGSSASDLDAGSYTVTVTDERGCQTSEVVSIVEPSQIVATVELTASETCVGNDGALQVNAMGGSGSYSYFWSNGATSSSNTSLSAGSYTVQITDGNGCLANAEGNVTNECESVLPTTKLVAADCGNHGYFLEDYISCEAIDNAEMYQWKFTNAAIGLWDEQVTLGNNTSFQLAEVTGLIYGVSASVSIKVMIGGEWSQYGEICQISMSADIPTTQLVASDCGMQEVHPGTILMCEDVAGAFAYEWQFSSGTDELVFTSYINTLTISEDMGLIDGSTYEVAIRSQVGQEWSEWGDACELSIDNSSGLDLSDNDSSDWTIYPNPNDGEKIFIEIGNLQHASDVIELELFNASGQRIEKISIHNEPGTHVKTTYTFENKLPSGMYFVRYTAAGQALEKKMIVR
ncbi:MAG: T9SS type A sorting domain-containing protein [Flavobacteriales bacterium]|nr:T9SS type A sorting domain-containing protein [Flavobacteriales bacterium]